MPGIVFVASATSSFARTSTAAAVVRTVVVSVPSAIKPAAAKALSPAG